MNLYIVSGSLVWRWLKIVVPVLGFFMTVGMGLGGTPVWAQQNAESELDLKLKILDMANRMDLQNQGAEKSITPINLSVPGSGQAVKPPDKADNFFNDFEDIKLDSPDQQPVFEALNQWMRQTAASYHYDTLRQRDPFLPRTEARGKRENDETEDPCWRALCCYRILPQLTLVAIVMLNDGSDALALFEDERDINYILRMGDQIGNKGRIVKITDSTVMVEHPKRGAGGQVNIIVIELTSSGLTGAGEEP